MVDHLLVFHGEGRIQDFPGNYTQYRDWCKNAPAPTTKEPAKNAKKPVAEPAEPTRNACRNAHKMSYKEKREFEQLTRDIEALEAEQRQLEEALCSGTLSIDELTAKSKRLPQLKDELDEKSMRWLELSELA